MVVKLSPRVGVIQGPLLAFEDGILRAGVQNHQRLGDAFCLNQLPDLTYVDHWRPVLPAEEVLTTRLAAGWSLDQLNRYRERLTEWIGSFSVTYSAPASGKSSNVILNEIGTCVAPDWAQVDQFFSQQSKHPLAEVGTYFDLVYRAGKLVFESFIDYVSLICERASLCVRELRRVASLIARRLRSGKGTADAISIFVNERSWYLHHSAHPPATAVEAVEGRFAAALRRARFRPLPA